MRHRHSGRQLGRNSAHRKAMYRNMTASLFRHERIRTTLPKAKELRRVAEPLITLSKNDAVARRRRAFDQLRDRDMVTKLFDELGPRYSKRPGGYLRILKCGFRAGDNAPMAIVELVEGGDPGAGKPAKSGGNKATRKSAGKPAASAAPAAAEAAQEKPAEAVETDHSDDKPDEAQAESAPAAETEEAAGQDGDDKQAADAAAEPAEPETDENSAEEDNNSEDKKA